MHRAFLLVVSLSGLSLPAIVRADDSAAIPSATPQQVEQTVERAILYEQTESAAWRTPAAVRRAIMAARDLVVGRGRTPGLCDRQEVLGRHG